MVDKHSYLDIDWHFASKNENDDFHTDIIFLRVCAHDIARATGHAHSRILETFQGNTGSFYFSRSETVQISNVLINNFFNIKHWGQKINQNIYVAANKLSHVFDEMIFDAISIKKLSLSALISFYEKQLRANTELYTWGWLPEEMLSSVNSLEGFLLRYLYEIGVPEIKMNEVFADLLFCPLKSVYSKELEGIGVIAQQIDEIPNDLHLFLSNDAFSQKQLVSSSITSQIKALHCEYKYLNYHGYGTRSLKDERDYYLDIRSQISSKIFSNVQLLNDAVRRHNAFAKRCQEYRIDENHQKLFTIYSEFGVSKSIRRLAQLKNFYYLDMIFDEVARRKGLPTDIVRFMLPEEFLNIEKLSDSQITDIHLRCDSMVYFMDGGNEQIIVGKDSKKVINDINKKLQKNSNGDISGISACTGFARGTVRKIIRYIKGESYFEKGDILVTFEADPDLIDLIKICSAVVTDQGGITCHMAIIAREFNIPCIVGTGNATNLLQDGMVISVDAYAGSVTIERGATDE
ncbi:hypothetical protein FACS18949_15980 [Clostridia bacterium]|nr:hypothetical protein FACS18949_15980 [Clostridia bacterium]